MTVAGKFQSTLPAGGATASTELFSQATTISIHAPRGGSDAGNPVKVLVILISIHAPRGGSDSLEIPTYLFPFGFQSTLPAGGATIIPPVFDMLIYNFNPRSPRGERQFSHLALCAYKLFQSTLPAGGATRGLQRSGCSRLYFNPRSPRGERLFRNAIVDPKLGFQSTLPAGGATKCILRTVPGDQISIHAPRGGSDNRHKYNIR